MGLLFVALFAINGLGIRWNSPPSPPPADPAPTDHIGLGKEALYAHNILVAKSQFQQAVTDEPDSEEANFFLGVTRIAALYENDKNTQTTALDSIKDILQQCGATFTAFGLYNTQGSFADTIPNTAPNTGAIMDYVAAKVLPEIDAAIANLAKVTSTGFTSDLKPDAVAKGGANYAIDYADALAFRTLLYAAKAQMSLMLAYNWDVSIPSLVNSGPPDVEWFRKFLVDHPSFGTSREPARLTAAKTALIDFIDTFNLAEGQITLRATQNNHLFVLDQPITNELASLKQSEVDKFKSALAEVKASLTNPTLYTFMSGDDSQRTFNLFPLFDANNPIDIRTKLADLSSNTIFPDPTFGGVRPGAVVDQGLQDLRKDVKWALTWHRSASNTEADLLDVAYNGTTYVAVGRDYAAGAGIILSSPDGVTWTKRSSPSTPMLERVVAGGGKFVALGRNWYAGEFVLLASNDGTTWTQRFKSADWFINDIAWGNGQFVAVGSDWMSGNDILKSPDSITWTGSNSNTMANFSAITWAGNQFVATSYDGMSTYVYTSSNLSNWQSIPSNISAQISGIVSGNNRLVGVGWEYDYNTGYGSSYIFTSLDDGATWAKFPLQNIYWPKVFFAGNQFVVTGGNESLLFSTDGLTWSKRDFLIGQSPTAITFGSDRFMIVGYRGLIRQSDVISTPPITLTGKVVVSGTNEPLDGVVVTVSGIAGVGSTSDLNGIFVLDNLPSGTSFHLKLEKPASGYAVTYSAQLSYLANTDVTARPYTMYPSDQIAFWGGEAGKGVISGRVMDSSLTTNIDGASVIAVDDAKPAVTFPVRYYNGTSFVEGSTTYGSGRFIVLNVTDNVLVKVTASKEGFVDKSRKYRAYADSITSGAIGLSEAVSATLANVTGTIANSPANKSGRIYIRLKSENPYGQSKYYGTSINVPGPFTIRGVPAGAYRVQAFMDVQGNMVHHLTDPVVTGYPSDMDPPLDVPTGGEFTIPDPIPLMDIDPATLLPPDPQLIPPVPPSKFDVQVADGAAILDWEQLSEGQLKGKGETGTAIYDGYEVDVVCGGVPLDPIIVKADPVRENPLVITGLDKTVPCDFTVYSIFDGVKSVDGATVTGKLPATPAGGVTVSGNINLNGHAVAQGAKIYVAAIHGTDDTKSRFTFVANPVSSQAYSIKGVPAGTYRLYAILDQNGNGVFDSGDIMVPENAVPVVTVAASPLTGKNITLSATESMARVTTVHWFNQIYRQEGYSVRAEVELPFKTVRTVTFTGGPGFQGIQDAGMNDWGQIELRWDSNMPPLVGDTYQLRVTFTDGTIENHTVAVTGVVGYPTTLAPSGQKTTYTASPTLTWAAPATNPTGALYGWWFNGGTPESGVSYGDDELPATTRSASLSGYPALDPMGSYYWGVSVEDLYGNRGEASTEYCGPDGICGTPLGEPPVVDDFQPRSGSPGTRVTITGSGFDLATLQVRFGATSPTALGVLARIISASDTEIVAEVPYGAVSGAVLVFSNNNPMPGTLGSITNPVPFVVVSLAALDTFIDSSPNKLDNSYAFTFDFHSNRTDATFECKVDTGVYQACTSPFSYETPSEGAHVFYVQAVDAYGKYDTTPATYTWTIDTIAPTATVTGAPATPIKPPAADLSLTVGGSGVTHYRYVVDGGEQSTERTVATKLVVPKTVLAADGPHIVAVIGRDAAYNWQPDPTYVTITADKVLPVVAITGKPTTSQDEIINQTGGSFSFEYTNDEPSTVSYECRLYKSSLVTPPAYAACSSPFEFANLSDETYKFDVRGKDIAGNIGQPANWQWKIDTIPADPGSITGAPIEPTNAAIITLAITNTNDIAAYKFAVDDGAYSAETPIATPLEVSTAGLVDGLHIIKVVTKDTLGNWLTVPKTVPFILDTTPPVPTIMGVANGSTVTSKNLVLQVTGADVYTYSFTLDGGANSGSRSVTLPIELAGLGEGAHSLVVNATDKLGNAPAPLTVTFVIDTLAPVAILAAEPADPNNKASHTLSVIKQGDENVVAYRYRLVRGTTVVTEWTAEKLVATPLTLAGLLAGDYKLSLVGRDAVGNWQTTPTDYQWKMYATLPKVGFAAKPNNPDNDDTPSFTFSITSDVGLNHYRYKVMKGTATVIVETDMAGGDSILNLTDPLTEGTYTITVWAIDNAGNKSLPLSYTWTLDLTLPIIAVTASPGTTVKPGTVVTLRSSTTGVIDWRYTSNGGAELPFIPAGTNVTAPGTDGQVLTIVVLAKDAAGNQGTKTVEITVSNAKPVCMPVIAMQSLALDNVTGDRATDFSFTCANDDVAFECKLDAALAFSACGTTSYNGTDTTATYATPLLLAGSHKLMVRAKDKAGNGSGPESALFSWTVDATGPTLTVTNMPLATAKQKADIAAAVSAPASLAACRYQVGTGTPTVEVAANANQCALTIAIADLAEGSNAVKIQGRDENYAWSEKLFTVLKDTVPPKAVVSNPPASFIKSVPLTLTIGQTVGTEAVSAYKWRLDKDGIPAAWSGSEALVTAKLAISAQEPGKYTLYVAGRDATANWQSMADGDLPSLSKYEWTVDTALPVAPTVEWMSAALTDGETNTVKAPTFKFTYADDNVTFQCKLDAALAYTACGTALYVEPDTTASYTTPILLQGNHTLRVKARDRSGNLSDTEATFSWKYDTTAPILTVTGMPAATAGKNTDISPVTVASTPAADLVACRYQVGSGVPTDETLAVAGNCTLTVAIADLAEGSNAVKIQARDKIGNWATKPYTVLKDTTPPPFTVTVTPATAVYSNVDVKLTIAGTGIAGYRYTLDGGEVIPSTTATITIPKAVTSAWSDGEEHTVYVECKDAVGNWGGKTITITVKETAPTAIIVNPPAALNNKLTQSLQVGGLGVVAYKWRLDKTINGVATTGLTSIATGTAIATKIALNNLVAGEYRLYVAGKDTKGIWQTMPTEPTASWTVELTPPDTTIVPAVSATLVASKAAGFSFTSTATDLVGFECKLDTALNFTACDNPLTLTNLTEGAHTLYVRAKDAAGNVDPTPAPYKWTVDTVAPKAVVTPTVGLTSVSLVVSGIGVAKYQYRIDGADWSSPDPDLLATKIIQPYGAKQCPHTVQVIGQDLAGNWQLTSDPTTYIYMGACPP